MASSDRVHALLEAMRATTIPTGSSGLWTINRARGSQRMHGSTRPVTGLWCLTTPTIHRDLGECVMHDGENELRTHLPAVLQARGRVLITGLGLGCVLRGVLASEAVESVDVVEREQSVLDLVAPHLPKDDRIHIHRADAIQWVEGSSGSWDLAWHDLWSNPDCADEHLQLNHARLLRLLKGRARRQGVWAFPRMHKRLWGRIVAMLG